jgi:antirestriction protein ArdC
MGARVKTAEQMQMTDRVERSMKNEKRCIVQAASYAQKAVDYLHSLQPEAKA